MIIFSIIQRIYSSVDLKSTDFCRILGKIAAQLPPAFRGNSPDKSNYSGSSEVWRSFVAGMLWPLPRVAESPSRPTDEAPRRARRDAHRSRAAVSAHYNGHICRFLSEFNSVHSSFSLQTSIIESSADLFIYSTDVSSFLESLPLSPHDSCTLRETARK